MAERTFAWYLAANRAHVARQRAASRQEFIGGYIAAMLAYEAWRIVPCHDGEDAETVLDVDADQDDLSWEALKTLVRDARRFWMENTRKLVLVSERRSWDLLGVDFALNRNGQGAGFWARNLGEIGDNLSDACEPWAEVSLLWDDAAGKWEIQYG